MSSPGKRKTVRGIGTVRSRSAPDIYLQRVIRDFKQGHYANSGAYGGGGDKKTIVLREKTGPASNTRLSDRAMLCVKCGKAD